MVRYGTPAASQPDTSIVRRSTTTRNEPASLTAMRKLHFLRKSTQPEDIFRWQRWQRQRQRAAAAPVAGEQGAGRGRKRGGPWCWLVVR